MSELLQRAGPAVLVAVALLAGCRGGSEPKADVNPLYVDPASRDFSENPALLERILGSPHGYFRFINIPFSREICHRFGGSVEGTPPFNLHGDAHLEQYAVTDLGRGLTDFDDSSTGPAVVDLLRFGVSLELACWQQGCVEEVDQIYDEFLHGYEAALDEPATEASLPAVTARLREGFTSDRAAYFEWIASLMETMPEAEKRELAAAMDPYVETMLFQDPSLGRRYFEIVDMGYLRMGIGSALDLKYLVRIRGATDEPLDDQVLEVKQVRELGEIACIRVSRGSDPFRILVGQSRIAYQPYDLLGYLRLQDHTFWIHAWVENYKELAIGEDFATADELVEVAYDVGVQLGRGHPNQIGAPLDLQLRREQMRLLERDRELIRVQRRELAELVVEAWRRFRERV
jgi:uncharacterized protein (DUF2252 family)